MKKVGELTWELRSYNTCQYKERVFHFLSDSGKLRITEVILGEKARCMTIITDVSCKPGHDLYIACCSLGQHILIMAEDNADVLAALVDIDEGPLSEATIHITELTVEGDKERFMGPYLSPVSENQALLYFCWQTGMWYCEVTDRTLTIRKLEKKMPKKKGFDTLPLRLPDGRLLVTGLHSCSKDITLISCYREPCFPKIGEIPGEKRCGASTVLVGKRFVVGFGGVRSGTNLADLWIFDLQTRRGSSVAKEGDWRAPGNQISLAVQGDTLYLMGGWELHSVHSISLQTLSELIRDVDIQEVLQFALGLEPRPHPAIRQNSAAFVGMRDLGGGFPDYYSHNTVDHRGRVFHFSQYQKNLRITEIFLGPWMKMRTVDTDVDCKAEHDEYISCCSCGDKILVIAGRWRGDDMFCALVTIDPGVLSKESIHFEGKRLIGWERYNDAPYLAQISENEVWASFDCSDEIWTGKFNGNELVMTKHPNQPSMIKGFSAPPLRLRDGRFLEAGTKPESAALVLITPGEQFSFEKIGELPWKGRENVSTILIGGRFAVGFGGCASKYCIEKMWVFDLQTYKVSLVKQMGEWRPAVSWPVLLVGDQTLYIIGGDEPTSAHSLSLAALSRLIQLTAVRAVFRLWLGIPLLPNEELGRTVTQSYLLFCL